MNTNEVTLVSQILIFSNRKRCVKIVIYDSFLYIIWCMMVDILTLCKSLPIKMYQSCLHTFVTRCGIIWALATLPVRGTSVSMFGGQEMPPNCFEKSNNN